MANSNKEFPFAYYNRNFLEMAGPSSFNMANYMGSQPPFALLCVHDKGWRLIQQLIRTCGEDDTDIDRLVTAITQDNNIFRSIIQDKHGSTIVQDLLEKLIYLLHINSNNAPYLLKKMATHILEGAELFINHDSANFVIQAFLKAKCSILQTSQLRVIMKYILNDIVEVATKKYASRVVETVLNNISPLVFEVFILKLLYGYKKDSYGRDAVDLLLFDEYGNYVMQSVVRVLILIRHGHFEGKTDWFDYLVTKIFHHEPKLRKSTAGKNIMRLIEDEVGHKSLIMSALFVKKKNVTNATALSPQQHFSIEPCSSKFLADYFPWSLNAPEQNELGQKSLIMSAGLRKKKNVTNAAALSPQQHFSIEPCSRKSLTDSFPSSSHAPEPESDECVLDAEMALYLAKLCDED